MKWHLTCLWHEQKVLNKYHKALQTEQNERVFAQEED